MKNYSNILLCITTMMSLMFLCLLALRLSGFMKENFDGDDKINDVHSHLYNQTTGVTPPNEPEISPKERQPASAIRDLIETITASNTTTEGRLAAIQLIAYSGHPDTQNILIAQYPFMVNEKEKRVLAASLLLTNATEGAQVFVNKSPISNEEKMKFCDLLRDVEQNGINPPTDKGK